MKYLIATFAVIGLMFGTAKIQAEEVIEETPTEEIIEETPTEVVEEGDFWADVTNVLKVIGIGGGLSGLFLIVKVLSLIKMVRNTEVEELIEKYGESVVGFLTKRPELIMNLWQTFESTEIGQQKLEELNHQKTARLYMIEEQMLRLKENIESKIYDNPESLKKAQEIYMKLSDEYEAIK